MREIHPLRMPPGDATVVPHTIPYPQDIPHHSLTSPREVHVEALQVDLAVLQVLLHLLPLQLQLVFQVLSLQLVQLELRSQSLYHE